MPVQCIQQGRTLTARLSGEVDHHAAKEMMALLAEEIDAALPERLVLELSQVSFMDSSGIAVLLNLWRRMGQLEGSMTIRHTPAQPLRVLRAAGLDKLLHFEEEPQSGSPGAE
ncbi:MAG: STAS domain-containing protein [Oscillospiraceae bacterium]|nr:STAS domain-containing protein [Oscillospiraceae bacterium]